MGDDCIKFLDKNAVKKIASSENIQKVISNTTDKISDKIAEKVVDKASRQVKQTAVDVKNKISETVENINAEISAMEAELKRKNLETMNQIRFNSNYLSDAQIG